MAASIDLIILGAGRPFKGSQHSTLKEASAQGRVLDWVLSSVAFLAPQIYFISGYEAQEVARKYPHFNYVNNAEWESTSSVYSFLLSPFAQSGCPALVTYADIVFHRSAVEQLVTPEADIAIAVDSAWRSRFAGRSTEDLQRCEKVALSGDTITRLGSDIDIDIANAEFVGLVHFSPRVLAYLQTHKERFLTRLRQSKMAALIEWLRLEGFSVKGFDLQGQWAELNEPQDLTHFILGTKAQTLSRLQALVTQSVIKDQVNFTVAEWSSPEEILKRIQNAFSGQQVVVRSSALSEDGFGTANAGAYTSVLNVNVDDPNSLRQAIEDVITSYPDGNADNQVLVQPMVTDVAASGVAFTRSLAHGAPYYVINYDDVTRSTESITSGQSREHKTLIVQRQAHPDPGNLPELLSGLLPALREVETLLHYDSLDIEFAVSTDHTVHILQVRPIAVDHGEASTAVRDTEVNQQLLSAKAQFQRLRSPRAFVLGERPIYGIMPDWNPAEIIGTKPGKLATSLYRYLIMDDIWATQRAEYGYRDVRPQPLLHLFAGHPYVDVRASFNSFIPASLDEPLAERLVNFYLDWLAAHPHLHDKVEFDVVPTCFSLDFQHWRERLSQAGMFSVQEIDCLEEALKAITLSALERNARDNESINLLQTRFEHLVSRQSAPLERASALLEDCKRYGTLPFAHLARSAFVAVTLLRSAVDSQLISRTAMDAFLNSIRTVTHGLTEDARATAKGEMPWETFVQRYGHLRPGTYDIVSPSYHEDPERFLRPIVNRALEGEDTEHDIEPWHQARESFVRGLQKAGIDVDIDTIEQFMRSAIEGREYAKFAFTRNLSAALDAILEYGNSLGINRESLSNIPYSAFMALQTGESSPLSAQDWLRTLASDGSAERRLATLIELPPLVSSEQDFDHFLYPGSQANFVGSARILAPSVDLDQIDTEEALDLSGKIVLIPQADPGYDWLFGQGIVGLITMYGGANSHMAIRSAEFGLPAAIGVGEANYQRFAAASSLELDAGNRNIRAV